MIITILTIGFLVFILLAAFFGYKSVIKRNVSVEDINKEKCSICRNRFEKSEMTERQIGDYKMMYFCRECVMKLYADFGMKN